MVGHWALTGLGAIITARIFPKVSAWEGASEHKGEQSKGAMEDAGGWGGKYFDPG